MRVPFAWRHDLEAVRIESERHKAIANNRLALLEARETELAVAVSERAQFEARSKVLEKAIAALNAEHSAETTALRREIWGEQQSRMAAQRGLVPYVRGLEAFNDWLKSRPELARQVEEVMETNGLWDIKLGYDPDKDLGLSVVSVHRA